MLAQRALTTCALVLVLVVLPPYASPSPAAGAASPASHTLRFAPVPGRPGMFVLARPDVPASPKPAAAAHPAVRDIPGFPAPNAMTRYGTRLYVSNYVDLYSGYLQVVDITVPGGEFITGVITAPVNTFDLAVVDDVLYATGQAHGELYERPLTGGDWISTTIRKNTSDVLEYGHLLQAYGRRMFVNHPYENVVDIVNLDTRLVDITLTGFEYLPSRIAFAGDYLVIAENGLSLPDCTSYGPHYSVFRLSDFSRVSRRSIQGDCPMDIVTHGGRLYVVGAHGVRSYDLLTGQVTGYIAMEPMGWHALSTGRELIVQQYWAGALYLVDFGLTHVLSAYALITPPNYWTPPIEEMAAMPVFTDGRVFVTNRDNSALSIVDLPLGHSSRQWLPVGLRLGP